MAPIAAAGRDNELACAAIVGMNTSKMAPSMRGCMRALTGWRRRFRVPMITGAVTRPPMNSSSAASKVTAAYSMGRAAATSCNATRATAALTVAAMRATNGAVA